MKPTGVNEKVVVLDIELAPMTERLNRLGKSRVCHPERAPFAGEGSAVRKKANEKADSSPRQKPNGFRNDIFSLFPHPVNTTVS
jgi:hypothetical protein